MAQKKKPTDPKGYYRLLKIAPNASADEIRLAYAMAKSASEGPQLRRLEKAYEILKNPKRRAAYHKEGQRTSEPLKSPITLVIAVVALIGVFLWLWLPEINLRRKHFRAGQTIIEIRSGRPFGEIVKYEGNHSFQGGSSGAAYLVKLGDSGSERWFPAIDLQATCDAR